MPKNCCLSVARQRKLGSEVPAGDVDVRLGSLQLRHHPGERFRAVDQNLERASPAWLRLSGGPAAGWSIERLEPADPLEPPPVVSANGVADRRSQPAVSAQNEIPGHGN